MIVLDAARLGEGEYASVRRDRRYEAKAAGDEGRPGGERVVARAELERVGAVRGCARRGERARESEARAA